MLGKLLMKLVINGIILIPLVVYLSNASWGTAFWAVFTFLLMTYVAVDQLFMRVTNNAAAVLADVLLTFVFIWLVQRYFFNWSMSFTSMAIIAIVYGIVEFFVHAYYQRDPGKLSRHSFDD